MPYHARHFAAFFYKVGVSRRSVRNKYIHNIIRSMAANSENVCIFCEIVEGQAHSHKIYEDELSLCILDINPFSRGHALVIPKRHVPWWHELSLEENASLFRVAKIVTEKIMKTLEPNFVCMYACSRRIPHTHIFLVPNLPKRCSGQVLQCPGIVLGISDRVGIFEGRKQDD